MKFTIVVNCLVLLITLSAIGASALTKQGNLNQERISPTDALWKAVAQGDVAGTRTAVSNGADPNELRKITLISNGTALHHAARMGYADVVVALISEGAIVDRKDEGAEFTPLHWAASWAPVDVARVLISAGADVDARAIWNYTPLTMAVGLERPNVALTLIADGADVNARYVSGQTALHAAAIGDCVYSAMILVDHGADVNARDNDGKTPLALAEERMSRRVTDYLRSVGGTKQDTKSATDVLWRAVATGDVAGTRSAVSNGADLTELRIIIDNIKGTALHLAALLGYADVAVALISKGASVHGKDGEHQPLHLAALEGYVDLARVLIAAGPVVDARDDMNRTSLILAAGNDRANMALTLMAAGADVNAKDVDGQTALHWTVKNDWLYSAMILVDDGADVNAKDYRGKTPLALAEEDGRTDIADYLRSVGGTT